MRAIDLPLTLSRGRLLLALFALLAGVGSAASDDRSSAGSHRFFRTIALTFDDGPHPWYTDRIIDVLQAHGARATFFVLGRLVLEYPELAQHIVLSGNEIASHTFTHRRLVVLSDTEARRELALTQRILGDVARRPCLLFRPPGGRYNDRVRAMARDLGQDMVLWTVFPRDLDAGDGGTIVRRVLAQAHDGGVVLLHSGSAPTLEALPRLLEELERRGYRCVTVSELKGRGTQRRRQWLLQ